MRVVALVAAIVFCEACFASIADSNVVVQIGTCALTAGEARNAVRLKARIQELRGRPVPAKDFDKWANRVAANIIPSLVSSRLLEQALDVRKVARTAEADACVVSRYGGMFQRKNLNAGTLVALFGDMKDVFARQFALECRAEAFYRADPRFQISDRAVSNEVRRIERRIAEVKAINDEAKAKGEKAWKRLNDGADWNAVAEEVSEDNLIDEMNGENFYREWEEFSTRDFPDETMAEAVMTLKPGQFTKPIETDEGLFIVKLVEKNEGRYKCVRIGFRMAVDIRLPSKDQIRENLRKKAVARIQGEAVKAIQDKTKIEYPMGKRLPCPLFGQPSKKRAKK